MIDLRKICVVTGTRAEYGLLFRLMKEIKADAELQLQIIATGMHLSAEFGHTYREIEKDGFVIDEKVEMLLSSDTAVGIVKSVGLACIGFADAYSHLQPDLVVILGDRYEALAAAESAMLMGIPIAHCHGGELTEGVVDESIRHAITKMSRLHFVAEPEYRRRVIQLGENPESVIETGALGIDNIVLMDYMSREQLAEEIAFPLEEKYFLVTYHPVTLQPGQEERDMKALFAALDEYEDYQVVFTKANSDAGGRCINSLIDEYAAASPQRVKSVMSLGQRRYLSAMKYASAVVGNSSSGILEAPVMGVPTVNIGDRQKGRKKAPSVIDCLPEQKSIEGALKGALERQSVTDRYPHADGKIAWRIKEKLKQVNLEEICQKNFYDWSGGEGA